MGQRGPESLQATRSSNPGGEVRQTRRQDAFQLTVQSLPAINITHHDLPDGACHPHACMLGEQLACAVQSLRPAGADGRIAQSAYACVIGKRPRRANWEARAGRRYTTAFG